MAAMIEATVRVQGDAAALEPFRRAANALLDADFDHEYRELHTAGSLDWRIKARKGIPFPAFASASGEFPDLLVEIEWRNRGDGTSGQALMQAGKLITQDARPSGMPPELAVSVRTAADGTIGLAMVLKRMRDGAWIGYVLTESQHAFFRLAPTDAGEELLATDGVESEWSERWRIAASGAEYEALAASELVPDDVMEELDWLAHAFADEWVWFAEAPEEDTAVERHRFELYGYRVHPANLRAEKLKRVMTADGAGLLFESLDEDARRVAGLVATHWLQTAVAGSA
ncbi:MAG: hypothetical protein MUC55_00165 [Burkholderiales bacterium]|nr:hypothetical protein [Burkholderiales bacterium]